MSETIGVRLPDEICSAFDGQARPDQVGLGYVVVTVDPDGRPRPAMLSPGEVVVQDPGRLRLGLWPGSRTGRNLRAGGLFCLCFAGPGTTYYVHGDAVVLTSAGDLDVFEVIVRRVDSDAHEGLPVRETITYTCEHPDLDTLLGDWVEQLAQIRSAAPTNVEGRR